VTILLLHLASSLCGPASHGVRTVGSSAPFRSTFRRFVGYEEA
jgi:hypothetical protein